MIVTVANPIYDSVFKFLMEDERIAKTLLSALLKKEVVEVEVRRHEYSNGNRDKISMFRIDFGAKVREEDGSIKRLEQVLSVFDQSFKDKYNHQVMNIDEDKYADDEEMQRIIHRLLSAASDAELRHEMNVEDEYFTALENRDTTIMMRDQKIKELDAQLAEKQKALLLSAKALKDAGIPLGQISAMTSLPVETIERLQ